MSGKPLPQPQSFHVEELAWQCIDRERNIWESPTGARHIWPRGIYPTIQVINADATADEERKG